MVLEATVLVLDNSEWMRNGDFAPSRLEAQGDAVNLLFNAKTQSNPENTVGLMTMAGKGPEVHVTLTNDIGKILVALHHIKPQGKASISLGIQVAQLMLKHRQNKNQRQRVIVFVGSPLADDEKSLVKLGKKLKKNNVALDIVNFGSEETENSLKLQALVDAVNSNDNSHLLSVPPGPHILSDLLISSPIVAGENGPPPGIGGGGAFEFGVDPSLDPELALALRLSMEEERARQETTETSSSKAEPMAGVETAAGGTEDTMMEQAIAMSMGGGAAGGGDVEMTEDEEIARAIAMSMEGTGGAASGNSQAMMNNVLGSLPGVDPNDPRFKNVLKKDDKTGGDKQQKQPPKSPKK